MRAVVISDSHRRSDIIEKILLSQPQARYVFFLGDCASDIEDFEYIFPDKQFFIVCGNCDYLSLYPTTGSVKIGKVEIFYTHGHTLRVKYGKEDLKKAARQSGCNIALYGHTHIPEILYEDGLYVVNPGSCSSPRSGRATYAVIDIEENGIMPIIMEVG